VRISPPPLRRCLNADWPKPWGIFASGGLDAKLFRAAQRRLPCGCGFAATFSCQSFMRHNLGRPLTTSRCGWMSANGHFCDIARSRMDFRFRGKSGHRPDQNPAMQPKLHGHCQPPRSERGACHNPAESPARPSAKLVIVPFLPAVHVPQIFPTKFGLCHQRPKVRGFSGIIDRPEERGFHLGTGMRRAPC
jgi:hypothetical protein